MNPQPTYKKFLLPGLVIVALVIVGLLLFLKDGAVDQGAALFTGITKTSSLRAVPPAATNCRPTIGANGLPVAPAPSVKVISPNGGETYQAGQQITVKWSSCNIPSTETVLIEMVRANSINNPIGSWVLLSQSTPNDGVETFTLNSNLAVGTYQLAVKRNSALPGDDISDNLFTINNPDIKVTVNSATTSIAQGANGTPDQGRFEVKFRVLNQGSLPLTIHSGCNANNSTGGISFVIDESGSNILQMFPATSCSLTSTATLTNGDYTFQPGEVQSFTLTVVTTPARVGSYRLRIPSVRYTLANGVIGSVATDGAGNQIKTAYVLLD